MEMCALSENSITPFGSYYYYWLSSISILHPKHLELLLGLLHISHSLAECIKIEVLLSCLVITSYYLGGFVIFYSY